MNENYNNNNDNKYEKNLQAKLGLFTTVSIVVGAVIGSGIFKKPALMASQLGSPELLILVWVLAGVITLFGALSNAEVASMISATGGQYVFFEKMYGKFFSFLYGWSIFAVIQTGSIASITYIFGEYSQFFEPLRIYNFIPPEYVDFSLTIPLLGQIFPFHDIGIKIVTISTILLLTAVNYIGVMFGGIVANIFTWMKILAILLLVYFGFTYTGGNIMNFTTDATSTTFGSVGSLILICLFYTPPQPQDFSKKNTTTYPQLTTSCTLLVFKFNIDHHNGKSWFSCMRGCH